MSKIKKMDKWRTYKAYTTFGNEIVYGSWFRKSSKGNIRDLCVQMQRTYGKYMSYNGVTDVVRWNG